MKKIKRLIAGLLIFTPAAVFAQIVPCLPGASNCYSGYLVNAPAQASSQTFSIDLAKYSASKVSAEVIYSSVNFTNPSFTDGSESVSSITVVSYTGLSTAAATGAATIVSTTSLGGAQIRLNNSVLVNGTDWFTGATKQLTAVSLAAAMAKIPNISANAAGGIAYATATYGSYANLYAFTSNNSSVTMSAATLTGGQDNAVLTINGVAISQGSGAGQWAAATSNGVTANNLAKAINSAFSTLSSTSSAGGTGSVVYATSTLNGTVYNYNITSSTQNSLKVNSTGLVFLGGTDPGLTLGSQKFSSATATGLSLGLPVLYAIGSNPAIGGLTTGTTYYVVPLANSSFSLAKYSTSAVAGLASDYVTVTSTNSQVAAHTYSLANPLAWAGTASFVWQSSDDNSNWATVPQTTSVNVTSSTLSTIGLYDFGFYNFRYLRLSFSAPTSGALLLQVPVVLKQDGIGPF